MAETGRQRRHKRFLKRVQGTAQRPRMVVFRSSKHIYAQLIDDSRQNTLMSFSTMCKGFKAADKKACGKEGAKEAGKLFAQKAMNLGIQEVCFDRGGYRYHGRIKFLAEGAREGGLKF